MAMIDEIERIGRAVSEGSMLLDDAADALSVTSDGGLTRAGAADLVANWATAREAYGRVAGEARAGLTASLDALYRL